jgi:hypothetical protein
MGSAGGVRWAASARPRGMAPGLRPSRMVNWFSLATIWVSKTGTVAATCASAASARDTSNGVPMPPS